MKKLLSIIIAVMLVSAMILPAAASTTVLTIEYTRAGANYTLNVPLDQSITNDDFASIGMVTVSDTSNFQNRHLKVAVNMTDFVGTNTNATVPAFLRVKDQNGEIGGDSNSFNLYFRNVDENGALSNEAYDDNSHSISELLVACYLAGNYAPTDTYTATITYTASVENNI